MKGKKRNEEFENNELEYYRMILEKKKIQLFIKRFFDIILSLIMLILLFPIFLFVSIRIKKDSFGPVFYKQVRITKNNKEFLIYKFRTMYYDSDKNGTLVTVNGDSRITEFGQKIRSNRIDELPQLINILKGEMSFVGTRPEVPKYVKYYRNEMKATLLLLAGVTSSASIHYKDESLLLEEANDPDDVYINEILPQKMKYNIEDIEKFSLIREFRILIDTVLAVVR